MYLIDDNTRRCVGVIDVVRMERPDIMGGVIHRATSIEVILDTGRELEFLAKDLYVDSVHNYHIRKMDTKKIPTPAIASIKRVIFNPPATIVFWSDGKKTVVKCSKNESFDPEKGLAMAIVKRTQGNSEDYYKDISKWCGGASAQKAKEKSKNDILDDVLELIASAKNTIKDLDKVRSNGLAFNAGQIDAALKLGYATDFIEDLKKTNKEITTMYTKRQKVNIDDTRFIFNTNFSGDPSRDRFGSSTRRVNVVIPTRELADHLVSLGVKVKETHPNPERTYDEPYVPTLYVPVNVNMDSKWPPRVYWITTSGKRLLCNAETVGQLDFIRVKNVCLQANLVEKKNFPGEYSLYADVMYVEQDADADPYAERYARYAAPEADMAEPSDPNDIPF